MEINNKRMTAISIDTFSNKENISWSINNTTCSWIVEAVRDGKQKPNFQINKL